MANVISVLFRSISLLVQIEQILFLDSLSLSLFREIIQLVCFLLVHRDVWGFVDDNTVLHVIVVANSNAWCSMINALLFRVVASYSPGIPGKAFVFYCQDVIEQTSVFWTGRFSTAEICSC